MTLLELLHRPPGETTAVVLPERGIRITYDSLRRQVAAAADVFASAGIGNAARVAMALPNGLETIVCFLGASVAGTAAPLNPAYRHDEFVFFLEDVDANLAVLCAAHHLQGIHRGRVRCHALPGGLLAWEFAPDTQDEPLARRNRMTLH